jgi:hypothetical protein
VGWSIRPGVSLAIFWATGLRHASPTSGRNWLAASGVAFAGGVQELGDPIHEG